VARFPDFPKLDDLIGIVSKTEAVEVGITLPLLESMSRDLRAASDLPHSFVGHPDDAAVMPRMSAERARIYGFPLVLNRACPRGVLLAIDHNGRVIGKVSTRDDGTAKVVPETRVE
jgi:hypothetical protein